MRRNALITVASIALLACKSVSGGTILSREHSFCGYAGGQIYCFGGETVSAAEPYDTRLYTLNVNQYLGQPTDQLSSKWEKVIPSTLFYPESRILSNAVVLSDGKRILFNGGKSKKRLNNQTIVYDTTTNSWDKLVPYAEAGLGNRQIHSAATINLPNGEIGFYGGYEIFTNISVAQASNASVIITENSSSTSAIGFRNMIKYSPDIKQWSPFSPLLSSPVEFFPNSQVAILDPISGIVYFLGGSFYNHSTPIEQRNVSLGFAYTFDTKIGNWSQQVFGGDRPSQRYSHTAILMPNSHDILLYGGSKDNLVASSDFCYTLNLDSNTWTRQDNVIVPSALSGPRFSHSTVLINTTLYVLFGRNLDGILSPSILSIDVANVSNIAYVDTVKVPGSEAKNNTNTETSSSTTGLSKGAIGGIAGGAAIVILAIIVIAFYMRTKKNFKMHDHDEQVSIDWDKIDHQYEEYRHVVTPNVASTPYSDGSTSMGTLLPENASNLHLQQSPRLVNTYFVGHQLYDLPQEKPFESGRSSDVESSKINSSTNVGLISPANDKYIDYTLVKPDAA